MEFGLSEEQHELAATVRSLLSKRADSAAVRCCVIQVESITARTKPDSMSLRNSMPVR